MPYSVAKPLLLWELELHTSCLSSCLSGRNLSEAANRSPVTGARGKAAAPGPQGGLGVGCAERRARDNGEEPGGAGGGRSDQAPSAQARPKRVPLPARDRAGARTGCTACAGTYAAVVRARLPILGFFWVMLGELHFRILSLAGEHWVLP